MVDVSFPVSATAKACALGEKCLKPVLQALLLADHVYQDAGSGKRIVAGIFSRLLIKAKLPTAEIEHGGQKKQIAFGGLHAGSPYAYISLTDVFGSVPLSLRYVDLYDNTVLLQCDVTVECQDRLATVELTLPMPPLPTPHTGVYALELVCKDEPIGALRVVVDEMTIPEQPTDG
ncbi:MAG TPA: hypothetical protein VIK18_02855 [Pirellulales bacterium]